MTYNLLAGGYRPSLALLSFDPAARSLSLVSDSPAPENPSWVVLPPNASADAGADVYSLSRPLYSLSEKEGGSALSLRLEGGKLSVTAQVDTHGAPCHVHLMKDGKGVVVSNYLGGSLIYIPLNADGTLSTTESQLVTFDFPYGTATKPAPNPKRQDGSHAHHTIEGARGLYVADLGSDRVWVVSRGGDGKFTVADYIQCAPGSGPRHLVLSEDETILYVLAEMGHTVTAYPASATSTTSTPLSDTNYLPPSIPRAYTTFMDGAELVLNPTSGELYASNRLELHASKMNPTLAPLSGDAVPRGDAVAVYQVGANGVAGEPAFVRTGACCIRGMALSPDGKYAALAGMCEGGIEVYQVKAKGEWVKVAGLAIDNVTDFAWL